MPDLGIAAVPAAGLEGDLGIKPQSHIFVGSMAPWDAIADELPQFDAYPPGFDAPGVERPVVTPREGVTEGSCLCGEVGYEITGAAGAHDELPLQPLPPRPRRGARHECLLQARSVPLDARRALVTEFKVPDAKFHTAAFCSRCGGKVPRPSPERGVVAVPAGSLDTDPGMRAQAHIFVADKAPWFEITGPAAAVSRDASGIAGARSRSAARAAAPTRAAPPSAAPRALGVAAVDCLRIR